MHENRRDWFFGISTRLRAIIRRRVAERVSDWPHEDEAVSDLTNDAFLTATEQIDDFRGTTEAEFVAWVSVIAENKLRDYRRAMLRLKRDVRRSRALVGVGEGVACEELLPDEVAVLEEDRQWVLQLVAQLPWRYRTAIRLRYLDGLPVADVADKLQCSETAAQGVLKRALVWLRRVAQGPVSSRKLQSSRGCQRPERHESSIEDDSGP